MEARKRNAVQIISFPGSVRGEKQEIIMKQKKFDDFTIYYSPSVKNTYTVKSHFYIAEGERLRKQKKFYVSSLREAKEAAKKWIAELYKVSSLKTQNAFTIFGECIEFYITRKDPQTNLSYFRTLKEDMGHFSIEDTNGVFHDFMAFLGSKATSLGKPYSNGTKNRYISYTKAILNYAVECDKIVQNPIKMSKFTEIPREVECSNEDIERLLEVCLEHAPHIFPIVQYASIIPSRISLLVNMKVNWIHGNSIKVPAQFTKHGKSDDTKPIPPQMLEYFQTLPEDTEYVFYRRLKKRRCISVGDFKKSWYKCVKLANLEGLRFHDLRHTSASVLLDMGISERRVMSIGNWRSNMFDTYYNRNSHAASQQVFEELLEKEKVAKKLPNK